MTPTQEEGGTTMEENAAPSMEMQSGTSTPMQGDSDAISIAEAAQVDHPAVCDTRVPFLHPIPHPVIFYRLFPLPRVLTRTSYSHDTNTNAGGYIYSEENGNGGERHTNPDTGGWNHRIVNGDGERHINFDGVTGGHHYRNDARNRRTQCIDTRNGR